MTWQGQALLVAVAVVVGVGLWASGYLSGAADAWRQHGPRCARCYGDTRGECLRRGQCLFR